MKEGLAVHNVTTCLNIDHHTEVRLAVLDDTVELRCQGTELELDAAGLASLIECGEQAQSQLGMRSERVFGDGAASTSVQCDSTMPMDWSVVGGTLEAHWGPLVLGVTGSALPELIRRARLAHAALGRRMAAPCEDTADLITPIA
jgi:hypothetical protein